VKLNNASKMGHNKHNDEFLKNSCNEFDYISVIYGEHIPKQKCICVSYPQKHYDSSTRGSNAKC
jgi:hypothetical protein